MGRYADWYLVELERLLAGRVSSSRLAETMCEIEAHLADGASDLEPACLHGQNPEALAVERFGSPRRLAYELLDLEGRVPYWHSGVRLAVLCTLAILLIGAWMSISGTLHQSSPIPLLACLCVVGFALVGFRRRRLQIGPVALAVGVLAIAGSFVLPAFMTRTARGLLANRDLPEMAWQSRQNTAQLDKQVAWIHGGIAVFAVGKPEAVPAQYRLGSGFYSLEGASAWVTAEGIVVPLKLGRTPPSISGSGSHIDHPDSPNSPGSHDWIASTTFQKARNWWSGTAPALEQLDREVVDRARASALDVERAIDTPFANRWWRDLPVVGIVTAGVFLIASLLHAASVFAGRAWLRWTVAGPTLA